MLVGIARGRCSIEPRPCRGIGSSRTETLRDQFKANATRVLRALPQPMTNEKVWTKGGDIDFIDKDNELEQVVIYVTETQDRMDTEE